MPLLLCVSVHLHSCVSFAPVILTHVRRQAMDDVRVRTSTGAIVTFLSFFLILILSCGEVLDYAKVHTKNHLAVDLGREPRIPILLDISFPRVPCYRK